LALAREKAACMRVLLIEDDSTTAQSIELMLKSESLNVYTADLGDEGGGRASKAARQGRSHALGAMAVLVI
jgi:DNA-binding response OmpR family regulator